MACSCVWAPGTGTQRARRVVRQRRSPTAVRRRGDLGCRRRDLLGCPRRVPRGTATFRSLADDRGHRSPRATSALEPPRRIDGRPEQPTPADRVDRMLEGGAHGDTRRDGLTARGSVSRARHHRCVVHSRGAHAPGALSGRTGDRRRAAPRRRERRAQHDSAGDDVRRTAAGCGCCTVVTDCRFRRQRGDLRGVGRDPRDGSADPAPSSNRVRGDGSFAWAGSDLVFSRRIQRNLEPRVRTLAALGIFDGASAINRTISTS